VRDVRSVAGATAPALYAGLDGLEDVLRRPELALVDIVVQDEYTHDAIFRRGETFLVFDTT
jgi:hypothetical protein